MAVGQYDILGDLWAACHVVGAGFHCTLRQKSDPEESGNAWRMV